MPKIAELFETMEYGPAPEVADEARAWIAARGPRFGHYIGGAWCEPAAGEFFATLDPSNEAELGEIAQGGPGDVDRAVAAARAAQAPWRDLGGHGRARYLYAIARHLQKHSRLFATLETLDNGKPIRESRDIDIPLVARHFYHHAGWAQLMDTELADCEPLGVAGQIIPWNFPLLMLAWKVAPALATGNTVVLKPAEFTSLTALRFAELCREIDLPPGVVNIVTGDGRTGAAIVEHPDVDKIAFTGSTEVGRLIREATAGTGKKISLELGGKSPFLVFDDADLDSVVEGVVDAIWFNQGQVCCAGSRILAHEGIADALADRLRARMETLRMGAPLDKGVDIGAIIAPVQLKKIESLVEEGREEGAAIWQPSWSVPRDGWFYPPTLCTDVSPAARIAQVEIFGPVVVQMTFRTPAEAVALANNTRYGLAASVWTENVNLALDIASQIKAGTVWINCTNVFDAASGFGGYRESGFGREGGREGLREYVRQRPEPVESAPLKDSETAEQDGRHDARHDGREGAGEKTLAPAPLPAVDRTAKLYIGGRQARPDGGYSLEVLDYRGRAVGDVARGNRKDARNAVEAALAADWARTTAHLRAQILYYVGENLDARRGAFEDRLRALTGCGAEAAGREVETSVRRLFTWAAWADKWDGAVHRTPFRNVTLAMPEPLGAMAVVCPPEPALLGFISSVFPAVALGNAVVAVASERWPLLATDFQQVLETSDVPAGVINILTGIEEELRPTLAGHDAVDGMWYFGTDAGAADVERRSASNLKRTWTQAAGARDWFGSGGEGREFLRHASQIKNIWVPYGE
ncbi:MAG: aldehyde dehydrogenase family protein [Gemmatimonadota bacterium]|uniref:aldehyde dehydrogenase family protein n=1 Tax=Candidatus Palauibacter scopulicola TaxID=3056741 RepID=UPI0023867B5C|nr:aldehyde dehydrogenase family protein [Candidatus Palauibacter scopulicola]MDE2663144.1 aldehyde dehydrogenase family protein [Candidatus Palauibacter scopulicola]